MGCLALATSAHINDLPNDSLLHPIAEVARGDLGGLAECFGKILSQEISLYLIVADSGQLEAGSRRFFLGLGDQINGRSPRYEKASPGGKKMTGNPDIQAAREMTLTVGSG
jgi:hypothetical protein